MENLVPEVRPQGVTFESRLTKGKHAFDTVKWVQRNAVIVGADGKEKFRQDNVEVPDWWNDTTVNVVVEKYFRVINGVKETSAKQMFGRVAKWLRAEGLKQGVFAPRDADIFEQELLYLFVHGMHAFNSPVWFNVGVKETPQCSACFIQSVEDKMEDIMGLATREVMLFKGGSGTGGNLSKLRSSYEKLSGGGHASGPVSFMKGYDAFAGATKSGGTTRRAAKMQVLNIDHPDILEQRNGEAGFITCKSHSEKVAHDLYSTGQYTAEWNKPGNVYDLVGFQNANNSVRVTDEFMSAVEKGGQWQTKEVKSGKPVHTYPARKIWDEIAEAAYVCGDPGIQFDTSTNDWHTCPESGRINASNPCSEYLFLDDTACNLSSLNLLRFANGREFKVEDFIHACELATTAKEIIVGGSSYPSEKITEMSHRYRTLGLGFTNLGALLTYWGLPYDSNEGRAVAGALSAIMGGAAQRMSAKLAKVVGPFEEYAKNSDAMLGVVRKHWDAAKRLPTTVTKEWHPLFEVAYEVWKEALELGTAYGYRNAQVTVIAPTGTISFLMGADTTGIEPMLGCVVYKKAVGEGLMILPNGVVEPALINLGYSGPEVERIVAHIREHKVIHTAPDFNAEKHGPVFAEALGDFGIKAEAHVDMMAAVQPFISGGISKTVNMPRDCSPRDIADIYMRAWKSGLKCVAVYRDGCKLSQPISTSLGEKGIAEKSLSWGDRRKMPKTRQSMTHKFTLAQQEGYITAGMYPDGHLGEVFVNIAKQGSTLNGMVDAWAQSVSIGLQHGVPLEVFKEKFCDMKFEPAGMTDEEEIRFAKSIPDYIFRWLDKNFNEDSKLEEEIGQVMEQVLFPSLAGVSLDGPPCTKCGNMTKRSGSCYCCTACGTTTGCS
jgi:ribonucleoside-diphosphate reductase alpha chain